VQTRQDAAAFIDLFDPSFDPYGPEVAAARPAVSVVWRPAGSIAGPVRLPLAFTPTREERP
jgi:hypothetical protein